EVRRPRLRRPPQEPPRPGAGHHLRLPPRRPRGAAQDQRPAEPLHQARRPRRQAGHPADGHPAQRRGGADHDADVVPRDGEVGGVIASLQVYRYEDIAEVHVELTTHCNASCPQCPRNLSGGPVNPALPLAELSLEDVRRILPDELLGRLRKVYACGNYGDPMVARDVLPIFEHLRAASPRLELGMFTNGSGRTPAFWAALAGVVTYVRFSIDGLEDTNHLYRRGTQWSRILASVEAFIAAGGRAEWDFIVF